METGQRVKQLATGMLAGGEGRAITVRKLAERLDGGSHTTIQKYLNERWVEQGQLIKSYQTAIDVPAPIREQWVALLATLEAQAGEKARAALAEHEAAAEQRIDQAQEQVVFHPMAGPTEDEMRQVLGQIVAKVLALLVREGYVEQEQGRAYLASADDEDVLAPLQNASITYRIAYEPRKGQKVLTLRSEAAQTDARKPRCVSLHGFSLHANVRCAANARQKLERLCRYTTRPALANERLALNQAGQAVLELKTPYQDGTTHLVFSPLEFLQRLRVHGWTR